MAENRSFEYSDSYNSGGGLKNWYDWLNSDHFKAMHIMHISVPTLLTEQCLVKD